MICKYFSCSVACHFTFLMVFFEAWKFNLTFVACAFGVISNTTWFLMHDRTPWNGCNIMGWLFDSHLHKVMCFKCPLPPHWCLYSGWLQLDRRPHFVPSCSLYKHFIVPYAVFLPRECVWLPSDLCRVVGKEHKSPRSAASGVPCPQVIAKGCTKAPLQDHVAICW